MPSTHLDNSEIVTGLLLEGRQSKLGYSPENFERPYNRVVSDLLAGKSVDELIVAHGSSTIQSCIHAAHSVNGLGESADWKSIIKESHRNSIAAAKFERLAKDFKQGISVPTEKIRDAVDGILYAEKSSGIRADELLEHNYNPFIPSGSPALDEHIMGIPRVGTFILGAKTFTGKTTVAIMLAKNFLLAHPDKEVLFVTLEDMADGWMDRAKTLLGKMPAEFWHRFIIVEFAKGVDDIVSEVDRYPDVGLVLLDYIDYLVVDKSFEKFDEAYRRLAMAAKALSVSHGGSMPIGILAQFSRQYTGGVPQPKHLYYSGEAMAWSIIFLYYPSNDWFSDSSSSNNKNGKRDEEEKYHLPAVQGKGYIIYWKVKGGFRLKGDNEFPGAVQVNWSPKYGFDLNDSGSWFSLAKETRS